MHAQAVRAAGERRHTTEISDDDGLGDRGSVSSNDDTGGRSEDEQAGLSPPHMCYSLIARLAQKVSR